MQTENGWKMWLVGCLTLTLLAGVATPAFAAREAKGERPVDEDVYGEIQARRQFQRARDLLLAGEDERGTRMLENIVEQFTESDIVYDAYLALGRHYVQNRQETKGIDYLRKLRKLDKPGQELKGDLLNLYLEGLYLTGIAYFQMKDYNQSFASLRRITANHPNTVWANQSYYYIGMCHFAQKNWAKAIDNLRLVGTYIDPESPTVQYVEAGRRLYIKVDDGDLPVLNRLGKSVFVDVSTASGDTARVRMVPLAENQGVFIGSVATEVGKPVDEKSVNRDLPIEKRKPITLQVIGGDTIDITYVDDNSKDGQKDVQRDQTVRVVSTASVQFTTKTFEDQAKSAFINQPVYVALQDADFDTSDDADVVEIRLFSRFRMEEDDRESPTSILEITNESDEPKYQVRDEVTITLKELGEAPVHSGRFGGSVPIREYFDGQDVDMGDDVLSAAVGDQVVAVFTDELHVGGEVPRDVIVAMPVGGEMKATPRSTQDVVNDPALKAKKYTVEAAAYLELARIFESMGLSEGAGQRAEEGLTRVDDVIRITSPIPRELREDAFRLKWELHLIREEYGEAIATCKLFAQVFPDSSIVDQALLGIGKIQLEQGDPKAAITTFQSILQIENSLARAEAQYRIAEATEDMSGIEAAIKQYQQVTEKFPDSPYSGEALRKMVKYYIATRDMAQANDLLERIFEDYQDAEFLDEMLAYWYLVLYRMGDYEQSLKRAEQLIYEYPSSPHAQAAKDRLETIRNAAKQSAEGSTENG